MEENVPYHGSILSGFFKKELSFPFPFQFPIVVSVESPTSVIATVHH